MVSPNCGPVRPSSGTGSEASAASAASASSSRSYARQRLSNFISHFRYRGRQTPSNPPPGIVECASSFAGVSEKTPVALSRRVAVLRWNAGRPQNIVRTWKYTLATFFPAGLYELLHPARCPPAPSHARPPALPPTPRPTRRAQVKRFANFYFLVVGAMQCMPWISLSDGFPGIYMPLLIIICIDLGIMGHEDYHR